MKFTDVPPQFSTVQGHDSAPSLSGVGNPDSLAPTTMAEPQGIDATGLDHPAAAPRKKRVLPWNHAKEQVDYGDTKEEPFAETLAKMERESSRLNEDNLSLDGGADLWPRPPFDIATYESNPITFQIAEIRESPVSPNGLTRFQIFGTTENGHSVMARVTGFVRYIGVSAESHITSSDLSPLCTYINGQLGKQAIESIELTKKLLWNSGKAPRKLIKVIANDDYFQDVIDEGGKVDFKCLIPAKAEITLEEDAQYFRRFMRETKIASMIWVSISAGKHTIIVADEKQSNCQLELSVCHGDIESCSLDGECQSKPSPLRILALEIQCSFRPDHFPRAQDDPVIQIASMVSTYGNLEKSPEIRNIFTLDTCSAIPGAQVLSYDDETQMLLEWRDFVAQVDPDIIIGYNIISFDMLYLLRRAETLGIKEFPSLGRLPAIPTLTSHKGYPQTPILHGRAYLDVFRFMKNDYKGYVKHRSDKLSEISLAFLDMKKGVLHYKEIPRLQSESDKTRQALAIYSLKDAYIPLLLLSKVRCIEEYAAIAWRNFVSFNMILTDRKTLKMGPVEAHPSDVKARVFGYPQNPSE